MAYIDVTDFKNYSKQTLADSDDDTLFGDLIDSAQGIIERYTGRVFEGDSDSTATRNLDASSDVDGLELFLNHDICLIDSVLNGDSDNTEVVSSDYVTNPRNETPYYSLKIKSSVNKTWEFVDDPEDAIAITGNWVYSLTPNNDIKQAMLRLTNWIYQQRTLAADMDRPVRTSEGITVMPMQLPADVKTILNPYRIVRVR